MFPQDPTARLDQPATTRSRFLPPPPSRAPDHPEGHPNTRSSSAAVLRNDQQQTNPLVSVPPVSTTPGALVLGAALDTTTPTPEEMSRCRQLLLRKEVIQPHLPVRLPCYDFVPIANPTFDSSLSHELGHWLRVLPTFVT